MKKAKQAALHVLFLLVGFVSGASLMWRYKEAQINVMIDSDMKEFQRSRVRPVTGNEYLSIPEK